MSGRLKKAFRELAILFVLFILVSIGINLYKTWDFEPGPAPQLHGKLLNGQPFLYPQGDQPMLVYFWGSWCPVCALQKSAIDSIAKDYPVITVAMQSGDNAEVQQYLVDNDLSFAVMNDPDSRIASQWSVTGVPAVFIISPDRQVEFVEVGYRTELGLRSRLWWARR